MALNEILGQAVLAFVRQATTHAAHPDLADFRARLLGMLDDALQARFAMSVVLRGVVAGAFAVLAPKMREAEAKRQREGFKPPTPFGRRRR